MLSTIPTQIKTQTSLQAHNERIIMISTVVNRILHKKKYRAEHTTVNPFCTIYFTTTLVFPKINIKKNKKVVRNKRK